MRVVYSSAMLYIGNAPGTMDIVFTEHARRKFRVLRRHGVHVIPEMVTRAVASPDVVDRSRAPLRIAQIPLDATHVLRVVYRVSGRLRIVITFYPGRVTQYGKNQAA